METCVLLPPELSVVLRPFPSRENNTKTHQKHGENHPKHDGNHQKYGENHPNYANENDSKYGECGPKYAENCQKYTENGQKYVENDLKNAGSDPRAETASRPTPPRASLPASPVKPWRARPGGCGGWTWEMGATVWANCRLLPGTTFTPDEGSVRLETLEIYRKLRADDVRYQFGLFDDIHVIDDEEVRHCNWVRFLRTSSDLNKVNMVAVRVGGHVFFQVVTPIPPNGELSVYFDLSQDNLSCSITDSVLRKEKLARRESLELVQPGTPQGESHGETPEESQVVPHPETPQQRVSKEIISPNGVSPGNLQGVPLGVSPNTSSSKTPSRSPESTRSLGAHSLMMTSPSDKEDDVRSTVSDVTSASESDSHQSHSAKSSFSSSFSSEARTPGPKMASPSPGRGHPSMESARMGVSPPTTHPSPSTTFSSPNMTSPGLMSSPLTSPSGSVTSPSGFPLGKSPEEGYNMRLPVKRNRERTWLPCEVCGKKFDRPSLLRRHMRTHTGEKPHACDVCGKAFSTSSSLNTHRRIHSGEKPHQCPVCGKRFTASSNLYYHRMTHNKDKPHKCTLCSKSFPTPGDLKSHMYVHNGSWPYKCDVCNRGFSKHTNLKNHLLLHTGDKPHECDLCGKRFALQCNLKTHMKTHEGEPQEECFKCGKVYLVSSRQVYNGYCRPCLQGPHPPAGPHPAPHGTPGPSPGPGGPSLGGGAGGGVQRQPHSFSVESLATSSVHHRGRDGVPGASGGGAGGTAAALSMSGYAMFDTKPGGVGAVTGVPVHPGNPLFTYAGIPWPKLVPQQY